jgi:hypothetical protein
MRIDSNRHRDLIPCEIRLRNFHKLTLIPAKVVSVDEQVAQYRVIVRIGLMKYRGSYETLVFGENKPTVGSLQDGRLHLIYYQDRGLKAGEAFPLWTIQ